MAKDTERAGGQAAVVAALAALPTDGWTVVGDVAKRGKAFANADLIVVGPPGIFVIGARAWSGPVKVRAHDLLDDGQSREAAVRAAVEVGLAVAKLVPLVKPVLVRPVICVTTPEHVRGTVRNVVVTSPATLVESLTSLPPALPPHHLRPLSADLESGLKRAAKDPPARTPVAAGEAPVKQRRSHGRLVVRLVPALALAAVVAARPELVHGVADRIGDVFVGTSVAETPKGHVKDKKNQLATTSHGRTAGHGAHQAAQKQDAKKSDGAKKSDAKSGKRSKKN